MSNQDDSSVVCRVNSGVCINIATVDNAQVLIVIAEVGNGIIAR